MFNSKQPAAKLRPKCTKTWSKVRDGKAD
jgi:hypothetical protein